MGSICMEVRPMWKVYGSELFERSSFSQVLYGNNILKVLAVCFSLHELWKPTIQQR